MMTAAIGLPDPIRDAAFYEDVPTKRFVAWIIDVIAITALSVVLTPLTLFTSIFFFPFFYLIVGFCYRWAAITRLGGTPGMRLMSIELRDRDGNRFDIGQSFLHTAGYTAQVVVFPAQFVSAAVMLGTDRRQGITDLVMGSVAINRAALA